jgi:plasmid stability protein
VEYMKMIQIRNVPDDLHRRLKARAAMAGLTLSDYLKGELERVVDTPSVDELLAAVEERELFDVDDEIVAAVRSDRNTR